MIPWKEVAAAIGKIFTLSQETQKNKADIKSLDEKVDKLSEAVKLLETEITQSLLGLQRVYYETQRLQDEIRHLREENERRDKDAARERENLILRLENQLLRLPQLLVNIWYNHSSEARGAAHCAVELRRLGW